MAIVDLLLLVILIALPFLYFSKNRKERRRIAAAVNQFKGEKCYPIFGTAWTQLLIPRHELFEYIYNRPKKYGPIYRSWAGTKPIIHVTQAKYAEVIFKSTANITKGPIADIMRPWLGNGLVTATGDSWKIHRKLITPTFHFKILDTFQEIFAKKSLLLVEELKPLADGTFFDIKNHIAHCALDIICETAMGIEINAMECFDSEYVKSLFRMTELIAYRWFRPWLHSDFLFSLSPTGREQKRLLHTIHGFADKVIADKQKQLLNSNGDEELSDEDKLIGKKKRVAFLDLLLQNNLVNNVLSDKELREEVDTFMFAGHDTTTATTCWSLFTIGNYPEVQEKIQQELDSIFHGEDRPITPEDLVQMQYTERVLKETLRIHSPVPYVIRDLTSDIQLDNKLVPAGAAVVIHMTNLHRDPEQFPDPDRFDPDRFLPENVAKRSPYSHVPFSAGPRNCMGQKFAYRSTKTFLAAILRKYNVKSKLSPTEIKYYGDMILKPQQGISLSLKPRTA